MRGWGEGFGLGNGKWEMGNGGVGWVVGWEMGGLDERGGGLREGIKEMVRWFGGEKEVKEGLENDAWRMVGYA